MNKISKKVSWKIRDILLPIFTFSVLYWFLDSILDSYVFHESDFLTTFLFPETMCLSMRLLNIGMITIFIIIAQWAFIQYKQTKGLLQENEKKYCLLLENVTDNIWTIDMKMKFTFISHSVFQMSGFTVEEAMGQSMEQIMTPDDLESSMKIIAEELELHNKGQRDRKRSRKNEVKLICKDGSTIWAEIEASFIYDSDGQPNGIIGISRNIVKRKQMEENLIAVVSRNEAILSATPVIIVEVDENKRYTWVNQVGLNFFGSDVIGKEASDFFEGENDIYEKVQSLFDGSDEVVHLKSWQRRQDGEKRLLSWLCKTLKNKQGNVIGALSSACDITEQKQQEEERFKMDKLESLGIMAGGIAHDFNNLLLRIMGNLSLAMGIENFTKQKEYLQLAMEAADQSRNLSQQLLTFAKGGSLDIKLNSVADIIRKSINIASGEWSESKCELDIADDLWLAKVDFSQIQRVFLNLIINADQAMSGGGIIRVKAENLELKDKNSFGINSGFYVLISVADTGIGIAEKYLKRIFDPFFSTKSKEGTGSGLGLAVVHSIVEKHGGRISVTSRLGKGTAFQIILPAIKQEASVIAEQGEQGLVKVPKDLYFLHMDDESGNRMLMKSMLETFECQGVFVKNGDEALKCYAEAFKSEKPFDLVILDLTIPGGKGGFETLKELLRIDPRVKGIICSGYSENVPFEGVKAYLHKPFLRDGLAKSILEAI